MLVLAVLCIACISDSISANAQVTPKQAWDQYRRHIKQLKTKLPLPLTNYLTLINARIFNDKLIYSFGTSHDPIDFSAAQTSIEYDFCQRTNSNPLFARGVTIIYEYYDFKQRRLGQVLLQSCSKI
jgi:hypothetical protein